jgi:hypothetical protein
MIDAVVGELVAGLVAHAGNRLATQITKGRRARQKERETADIHRQLTIGPATKALLASKIQMPAAGVTRSELNAFLSASISEGVAFELLTCSFTEAPEQFENNIHRRWLEESAYYLIDAPPQVRADIVNQLFGLLKQECHNITSAVLQHHPAVATNLRQDSHYQRITNVLEAIERRLAEGQTGVWTAPTEKRAFTARYLSQAKIAHGYLTPPDFDRRKRVPVASLYVSPTIKLRGDPDAGITLKELLARLDRTVLLGDPGGGKSTAATVILHQLTTIQTDLIPFLITLREFAAGTIEESVVEHIEKRLRVNYQCQPPASLVDYLLSSGRALVIFDGLDELLDTFRRREVTDVVALFCGRYPLAKVLVTSRRVGYDQAPMDPTQFTVVELAGFDDQQIHEYVAKWFRQDETLSEDAAIEWTNAFVTESASVRDLRSNPLLLALMCIIYRGEQSIPKDRPGLYERCATMLFEKWDSSRKIHIQLRAGRLVDPAMKYLAYWMLTTADAQEGVRESLLIKQATNYLGVRSFEDLHEAEAAAQEFVEFCRGRAWVFSDAGSTADGESIYKFTHRTFMEYFAAYHLTRISDTPEKLARQLIPRIARSEWDVVAQLAIQIMDKHNEGGAARVFRCALQDKVRRSSAKRDNILGFLCRCLIFATIPPQLLRTLVAEVVDNTLTMSIKGTGYSGNSSPSLGWLLRYSTDEYETIVKTELRSRLVTAASTDDIDTSSQALVIAAVGWISSLMTPVMLDSAVNDMWREFFADVFTECYRLADTSARQPNTVMAYAIAHALVPFDSILPPKGGLSPLFSPIGIEFYKIHLDSLANSILSTCMYGRRWIFGSIDFAPILTYLASIARHTNLHLDPEQDTVNMMHLLADYKYHEISDPPPLDDERLLGACFLLCAHLESMDPHHTLKSLTRYPYPREEPTITEVLGLLSFVASFWQHRFNTSSLIELDRDLPRRVQDFLEDWANKQFSIIRTNQPERL